MTGFIFFNQSQNQPGDFGLFGQAAITVTIALIENAHSAYEIGHHFIGDCVVVSNIVYHIVTEP